MDRACFLADWATAIDAPASSACLAGVTSVKELLGKGYDGPMFNTTRCLASAGRPVHVRVAQATDIIGSRARKVLTQVPAAAARKLQGPPEHVLPWRSMRCEGIIGNLDRLLTL
jgi:hypothetical protein